MEEDTSKTLRTAGEHDAKDLRTVGERDPENLRTEYSALASYYATVITFRFTTVGFFLVAAGLFVQAGISRSTSTLLLLLTIGAWIVDLRNRAIFAALHDRAVQIEKDWNYQGHGQFDPLFRRMIRIQLQRDLAETEGKKPDKPFPSDRVQILGHQWRLSAKLISHSTGLDVIYLGVLIYAAYIFWRLTVGWK